MDIEPRYVSFTMMFMMTNGFSSTPKAKTVSQKDKPPSRSTKNPLVKSKTLSEKDMDTGVAELASVVAESFEETVSEIW